MNVPEEGYLLRVFVGESDRCGHRPLYEEIVLKAREAGLAGATVLRGVMGFGRHSFIHTTKILRLSEDMPMVRSEERRVGKECRCRGATGQVKKKGRNGAGGGVITIRIY